MRASLCIIFMYSLLLPWVVEGFGMVYNMATRGGGGEIEAVRGGDSDPSLIRRIKI